MKSRLAYFGTLEDLLRTNVDAAAALFTKLRSPAMLVIDRCDVAIKKCRTDELNMPEVANCRSEMVVEICDAMERVLVVQQEATRVNFAPRFASHPSRPF